MSLFYSTTPAGLETPAARLSAREIKGFSLKQTLSGALIYAAGDARPRGSAFQNTYLLLARRDRCPGLRQAAEQFAADGRALREAAQQLRRYGFQTWRVMFSEANRLRSVEPALRARFERAIPARVDRVRPDTELLVLRRSEGAAFLLLRLTRPAAAPKNVQKGELSPAIARCMAALARPRADGAFLDPFAGYGALGAARLALGPAARVCLSDIDADLAARLRTRFGRRAEIACRDALVPDAGLADGSFSEIVTDPPWGLYAPLPLPEAQFYARMLERFARLLTPDGTCIVLTAAKESLLRAAAPSGLEIRERYDLLVNGKKAAIFVLQKAGPGN